MNLQLTILHDHELEGHVALCPELDIASEGDTVEEARANLKEALALFFDVAPAEEVARRLSAFQG